MRCARLSARGRGWGGGRGGVDVGEKEGLGIHSALSRDIPKGY